MPFLPPNQQRQSTERKLLITGSKSVDIGDNANLELVDKLVFCIVNYCAQSEWRRNFTPCFLPSLLTSVCPKSPLNKSTYKVMHAWKSDPDILQDGRYL